MSSLAFSATIPLSSTASGTSNGVPTAAASANETFDRLPLMFEAAGNSPTEFLCRGAGYQLFLAPTEATLVLNSAPKKERVNQISRSVASEDSFVESKTIVRVRLHGARTTATVAEATPLSTRVSYFIGNDPDRWRLRVPAFGTVRYEGVYPGVDLVYYGNQRQLEYDFVIAPGANADTIALRYEGARNVVINAAGDLVLQTSGGPLRQRKPVAYQDIDGARHEVAGRYVWRSQNERTVGFEIGAYDRTRPLVIDPILIYSTYFGGLGFDRAWSIAVDTNGCAYIAGETGSLNFPTNNALYPTNGGGLCDAFVAKLDAGGTNLVYATYFGGNDEDAAFGITVDPAGNAYLTGLTASTNFPVTLNAVSTNIHGSLFYNGFYPYDAFVAKLDANGTNLLYSTYLGGDGSDEGISIALDNSGGVYVTGDTTSTNFPAIPPTTTHRGGQDAFVVKLTAVDSNLVYSVLLGGSGNDFGRGLGVDAAGNAVVGGITSSIDFPVTNAWQTNFAGGTYDGFITKLSTDGSTQLFSTYLGGQTDDEVFRLALDNSGNIYLTGLTSSTNFPISNALVPTNSGFEDTFVAKMDPTGTNLIFSTYLGGIGNDEGWNIALDASNNIYIVGLTTSTNFPTTNAFQSTLLGATNAFLAKLDAGGASLNYSTYLGGTVMDVGYGVAVDKGGNAYVAGLTASANFPVLPATNGMQTAFGGGTGDAFIVKFSPNNDAELRAQLAGSNGVTVLWPSGLLNFELQSAGKVEIAKTNWIPVTNTPVVVGNDNSLVFTNATSNRFFRLHLAR